ncbi:hypothetical protein HHI36_020219 [Cryptolaemus montrouzieri]|uniref:Uncharacterized protein n=1 Tax=Cryptolaemus montrouzieri TaxID=559131 RepID=A0ABD2NAA2_9CUCU
MAEDSNPKIFRGVHTQYPEKLNVSVGIYGNLLFGPFFLPENLTGEMYLQLLEELINLVITEILENDPSYLEGDDVFQQDGAPRILHFLFDNIWIENFLIDGLEEEAHILPTCRYWIFFMGPLKESNI